MLYRKKSYHSIVQPMALAIATLRMSAGTGAAGLAVVAIAVSSSIVATDGRLPTTQRLNCFARADKCNKLSFSGAAARH